MDSGRDRLFQGLYYRDDRRSLRAFLEGIRDSCHPGQRFIGVSVVDRKQLESVQFPCCIPAPRQAIDPFEGITIGWTADEPTALR
jgi:hypothetical protein